MALHLDSETITANTVDHTPESVAVKTVSKISRYDRATAVAKGNAMEPYGSMTFLEKLRALMKVKGLSTRELGPMIGTYPTRISKWFGGQGLPDIYQTLRLSRSLDVPMEYLANDEMEQIPPASELADDEWSVVELYRALELDKRAQGRQMHGVRIRHAAPVASGEARQTLS